MIEVSCNEEKWFGWIHDRFEEMGMFIEWTDYDHEHGVRKMYFHYTHPNWVDEKKSIRYLDDTDPLHKKILLAT